MLSCAVFRPRAPSWRSFLLIINFCYTKQDTYEVWGFLLQVEVSAETGGSVMDVFAEMEVETNGHPLMTSTPQKAVPVERHLCPECRKSYVQKRNLVRHKKQHHKLDDWPRFPCTQCDKKYFTTNSTVRLKSCHICYRAQIIEACSVTYMIMVIDARMSDNAGQQILSNLFEDIKRSLSHPVTDWSQNTVT